MNGTLDGIIQLFQGASYPLFARVYLPMRAVFVTLFVIDFAWSSGTALLTDRGDFWGKLTRKLVVFAFLWGLLVTAPFWLWRLLDGFSFLAEDLTGASGLSPSAVLQQGVDLFFQMFSTWQGIASFFNPIAVFLRLFTALTLLGAFVLIAFYLFRVLVESALALGALAFFLAFSGHAYTWGLTEGYIRYLLDLGVRIFVVYLLVGIGDNFTTIWLSTLESASAWDTFTDPRIFLGLPMTAIIWATLVLSLPRAVSREIVGPFSMNGLNPMGRAAS